jgi:hypothetical protein
MTKYKDINHELIKTSNKVIRFVETIKTFAEKFLIVSHFFGG